VNVDSGMPELSNQIVVVLIYCSLVFLFGLFPAILDAGI
jgi:hypothetical protein